jgi:hypothetical protein
MVGCTKCDKPSHYYYKQTGIDSCDCFCELHAPMEDSYGVVKRLVCSSCENIDVAVKMYTGEDNSIICSNCLIRRLMCKSCKNIDVVGKNYAGDDDSFICSNCLVKKG